MGRYRLNFERKVWGFYETEAETLEEAKKKIEEGDCDMFDNKSDETLETNKKGDFNVHLD